MCYNVVMIKISGVTKLYNKSSNPALRNVNLSIEAGDFVSIVGQSGTGKTTLVKLIIAEERPTRGTIHIGDWDITNISFSAIPYLRRQIGVVFQDFRLLPKKTVYENVAFALEVAGYRRSQIHKVVPQVLDVVGLSHKIASYPNQLSGGEQQRTAIARSLAHAPKIIVADEPTGNLDSINTAEIINILKKINEFGTTILLVTHNRDVVNHLRRRVISLHDGEIISDEEKGKYKL